VENTQPYACNTTCTYTLNLNLNQFYDLQVSTPSLSKSQHLQFGSALVTQNPSSCFVQRLVPFSPSPPLLDRQQTTFRITRISRLTTCCNNRAQSISSRFLLPWRTVISSWQIARVSTRALPIMTTRQAGTKLQAQPGDILVVVRTSTGLCKILIVRLTSNRRVCCKKSR